MSNHRLPTFFVIFVAGCATTATTSSNQPASTQATQVITPVYYIPPHPPAVSYTTLSSVNVSLRLTNPPRRHSPVEAWDTLYPGAAAKLDAWAAANPGAVTELLAWDARESDRARAIFEWSASTEYVSVADFVIPRGSWDGLSVLVDHHMNALEQLVAWCRKFPDAALIITDQPNALARLAHTNRHGNRR